MKLELEIEDEKKNMTTTRKSDKARDEKGKKI